MEKYKTYSEEETRILGTQIAKSLKSGDIVALSGDLGCGKTAFVKGVTDYFGDGHEVTSPTFTLVNQYDGDITLYHFDVYRLENLSIEECHWMDDYFFGDGICIIEWADNIKSVLPDNTKWIYFSKNQELGDDFREIVIQ